LNGQSIKAVIFDLGNVLIDFDHRIAAQKISRHCDKADSQIYQLFFDSHLTGLFEEGLISPQEFFLRIKEMLGLAIDYDEFVSIWNGIFFLSTKNLGVYSIARSLRENYKLAALTNVNALHFEYVKRQFPVFDAFHAVFASCDLGMRKPDPLIYTKTIAALGVQAEEVFYTDDRSDLIESANSLGIRGFVFKGVGQLKEDLASAGINID